MLSALRLLIVGVVLISFTACTSLQTLEDFRPSTIRARVHVGDRASILWWNGSRYDITVTAVDDDALRGVSDSRTPYKLPFEGIRSIDVEKTRTWQAVTVVMAVATVTFVILLLKSLRGESGGGEGSSSSGKES